MWMIAAALGALMMSACGSTARQEAGPAQVGSTGELTSEAADPGTDQPSAGADRLGTTSTGAASAVTSGRRGALAGGGVSPGSAQPAATAGAQPGGSSGGVLPAGPGVQGLTDTTIQIGMQTSNAAAAVGTAGAISGESGDAEGFSYDAANAAAVEAVNSQGGIAGRKVEPVYWFNNPSEFATASGRQRNTQRACATWTEDHRVFAFAALSITEENIYECAVRAKTPMVVGRYHLFISQRRFESMSDYWYGPDTFTADRRERSLGRFLLAHDWFGKDAKVALLIEDKADHREGVERGLRPVLAAAGIKPTVEIAYPDYNSAPWSNYVLQLQTAGISHVIWSATSTTGFAPILMLQAAENQQYRPKWAMGSDEHPDFVAGAAPTEQLVNVVAMGWKPNYDTGDDSLQSSTAHICGKYQEKRGQEAGNAFGQDQCGVLFFLKAALERAPEVSARGLAMGTEQLGDTFAATSTIGGSTRFASGHDGVAIIRDVAYEPSCECFKYTTGPEAAPG